MATAVVETLKDVTVYGGIIVYTFWQWSDMGRYKWRNRELDIVLEPPRWMFPVAWTLLYGLISAAWIVFLYTANESQYNPDFYVAIYVLLAVNVALNKMWTRVAADWNRPRWAFLVILLVLVTAIAVQVLFAVVHLWVSFGLYMAYPLWLLVATYLNVEYAFVHNESMVTPLLCKHETANGKVFPVLSV